MIPTGYRVLWAYAVRSLGDRPRSRGKSRPAVSGEFLHPVTVRSGSSLRTLCSSEASAWTAKHGTQHKALLLVSGPTMTWVQPFKPPLPFIHPIQPYSTGQTEILVFPHLSQFLQLCSCSSVWNTFLSHLSAFIYSLSAHLKCQNLHEGFSHSSPN